MIFFNNKKNQSDSLQKKRDFTHTNSKRGSSTALNIDYGLEGNYYNNKVPNDNTLAISNDGLMIAGINSSYLIYDQNNDSILKRATLNSLTFSFNQLLFVKKYDPKFIYDPNEDRFILVFLVENNPINNHICVAFSSSNNPLDDWNVYMLTGDALCTDHWTDYPAISLTDDELFITGNLLQHNVSWQEGFYQSLIWQIDKTQGYQGNDTLDFNLWSELKDDSIYLRNIHPIKVPESSQSKHQYFLIIKNFSLESDTLYLIYTKYTLIRFRIFVHAKNKSYSIHIYFLSPNGRQYNGKELSTNDSRVLGGIIDKDWIQYVHHSMDTATGNCGIYHGIIYNYNENPYVESHILSDSVIDFGYPNIASTAINPNEHECVIGFDFTSPVDTNGLACVYMDNDRSFSMQKLVTGDRAIDRLNGNVDRWGDYTGIQRSYNEKKTWLFGDVWKDIYEWKLDKPCFCFDTCREPLPHLFLEPEFKDGKTISKP